MYCSSHHRRWCSVESNTKKTGLESGAHIAECGRSTRIIYSSRITDAWNRSVTKDSSRGRSITQLLYSGIKVNSSPLKGISTSCFSEKLTEPLSSVWFITCFSSCCICCVWYALTDTLRNCLLTVFIGSSQKEPKENQRFSLLRLKAMDDAT